MVFLAVLATGCVTSAEIIAERQRLARADYDHESAVRERRVKAEDEQKALDVAVAKRVKELDAEERSEANAAREERARLVALPKLSAPVRIENRLEEVLISLSFSTVETGEFEVVASGARVTKGGTTIQQMHGRQGQTYIVRSAVVSMGQLTELAPWDVEFIPGKTLVVTYDFDTALGTVRARCRWE